MRIDLHAHTTASDGTFSPSAFAEYARGIGVDVAAVTDHDTVDGIDEAVRAADGVEIAAGIELSTSRDVRKIHILGLLIDHTQPQLLAALAVFRADRQARGERIVQRLNELGLPVTMEDVRTQAGKAVIARPHVARALVVRGLMPTVQDAFSPALLGDGGAADVAREPFDPAEAVALVHAAGGVAVLAHPGLARGRTTPIPDALIRDLARAGLDGIEVDHPEHGRPTRVRLRKLAAELGVVTTGGSDCHGPGSPGGARLGGWTTSTDAFAAIRARARRPC